MRKPSPQVPGERAGPAAGLGAADREIPGITAPMHRYWSKSPACCDRGAW